ncbi:FUSC family protein [Synechococcus sp. RSCCF101]|uniref:FUSC family protein n=1 Tax=Synechococcus sp. RSCCF101 TaxID=2511069 RepID=UPI001247A44B|nr:FUSC family protein [Synechococcus sp. RSCCF101]QEY31152.1 FUSC family protein [Synechococcus sp. RSCCF101]
MAHEALRQSLRLGLSAAIACTLAIHWQRVDFVWYPLLAILFVIDDRDESTLRAARGRILGTITGGLVAFLVHTILVGWPGVLVSLLITIPLVRRLGWSPGLSTAAVIPVIFLSVEAYSALDWTYVFNRALDTAVGIAVALLVCRLLWPRNRLQQLCQLDAELHALLLQRRQRIADWLRRTGSPPEPIRPAQLTSRLLEAQRLLASEEASHGGPLSPARQERWPQRLLLWQVLIQRWMLCERLLERLGRQPSLQPLPGLAAALTGAADASAAMADLASRSPDLGPFLALSLEEELTRLLLLLRRQQRLESTLVAERRP